MIFLYISLGVLAFLLLLFVLWLFCLLSYEKNDGMDPYKSILIAHRGLHNEQRPENSMAAFAAAADAGFPMEFDLHLTADGRLAVHHDDHTARMCGQKLVLCESTFKELRALSLPDGSKIPSFEELLALVNGRVPLLIELKSDKGNASALVDATLKVLENYPGKFLIESFDPRVIAYLRKKDPTVLRGQLSDNFFRNKDLPLSYRFLLTLMLFNLRAKPHFIAYNVDHASALPLKLLEKAGAPVFFWTVRDPEVAKRNSDRGQASIFERFIP